MFVNGTRNPCTLRHTAPSRHVWHFLICKLGGEGGACWQLTSIQLHKQHIQQQHKAYKRDNRQKIQPSCGVFVNHVSICFAGAEIASREIFGNFAEAAAMGTQATNRDITIQHIAIVHPCQLYYI